MVICDWKKKMCLRKDVSLPLTGDNMNTIKKSLKDRVWDYLIKNEKYDCMVGLSGGKDSSAMLYTVKKLGFTPLAFSFEIGYNKMTNSVKEKIKRITNNLNVDYERINIIDYQCSYR